MAKVSLRIYNQEIENLVDSGQLDEAIAHCRHILNAFPKHLDTYRLLGKAYLEAKRYNEATDIFERVLMAVPDDFVSNVGMSIINDEQQNMDAAIWHMERAFEVQPSNSAIQGELQRLYGRRDGIEPPKIRLTRGALAHMYVQGDLNPQAIAEIKSVLDEDPNRQDMQVLLARAYFHSGQKSEAAEICSQLLRRYPYSFDANRVLVELLPQTERGESTQVYRHRISELDPYCAFATGSVFHTEDVPDAAISLEKLEWDGQAVDMQPAWDDSLGIKRGEKPAPHDEQPDWLKPGLGESAASTSTDMPAPAAGTPSASGGDEEIPGFMREAGWGESTGAFQESPGSFETSDESDETPLAEGDLPDWVKALAPTGASSEGTPSPAESTDDLTQDNVPDWLQDLDSAQSNPPAEQPLAEEGLPDWLESMKPTGDEEEPSQAQEPAPSIPASEIEGESSAMALANDENVPDWLKSLESEDQPAAEPSGREEETPDWLKDLQAESETGEPASVAPASEAEAPEWLKSMQQEESEQVATPSANDEETPDWLKSMQEEGEQSAESSTGDEDVPDWLKSMQAEEEQVVPAATDESLSDWQINEEVPADETVASVSADANSLGTSAEEQDDAIAWLEGLASKHGAKPEELVTKPEDRKEVEPDWVQKAKEVGASQPETPQPVMEEPVQAEAEVPAGVPEMEMPEQKVPVEKVDINTAPALVLADLPGIGELLATNIVAFRESYGGFSRVEDLEHIAGIGPETIDGLRDLLIFSEVQPLESAPDWALEEGETAPPTEAEEPAPLGAEMLGTSTEEQDDAIAWLEGLASKHGAKPEELVTRPEDRKEVEPDWVQKAKEVGEVQPPAAEEPIQPVQEGLEQPEITAEKPEAQPAAMDAGAMGTSAEEQDDAIAWLEGLASKHGAKPEELVTNPEDRKETAPDWVQKAAEVEGEQPVAEEPVSPTETDETGMWLRDLGEGGFTDQQEVSGEQEEEPTPSLDIPDWLREIEAESSKVEPASEMGTALETETLPEPEAGSVSEAEAEPESLDWLQQMEADSSTAEVGETSAEEGSGEDLPSWLADLEKEDAGQQPVESDSDLPDWLRAEAETEPPQPMPSASAEWKPAETAEEPAGQKPEPEVEEPSVPTSSTTQQPTPPAQPEPEREPYREPITRSRTGMTGMLSMAQDPMLTQAQNELIRSNIPGAMENYEKLIKKGKMLDEVIFDLREALYRYPVEVGILQTLGDAYMRANRLQDALDAYTKAEELLR